MSPRNPLGKLAAATTVVVVGCVVTATAMGGGSNGSVDGSGTTPTPAAAEAAMTTSVAPAQAAAYSVLRAPQQPGDDPGTGPKGPFGANLSLARRVDSPAGPVWVVPAQGYMCLRAKTAVSTAWTCVTDADAAQGRLILSLRPSTGSTVTSYFALVPDGATDATLSGGASPSAPAQMHSNVIAGSGTTTTGIDFTDATGARHSNAIP